MFIGQMYRLAMTTGERFSLTVLAAAINRADGMNHVLRRKCAARSDNRFSRRENSELNYDLPALGKDGRATRAVDRAVNSASTQQIRIRGIHNRVRVLQGDIGGPADFNHFAATEHDASCRGWHGDI